MHLATFSLLRKGRFRHSEVHYDFAFKTLYTSLSVSMLKTSHNPHVHFFVVIWSWAVMGKVC